MFHALDGVVPPHRSRPPPGAPVPVLPRLWRAVLHLPVVRVQRHRFGSYGADYPGTKFDYGQAAQFATTMQCGGPFGPDSTYCDTVISPTR